MRYKLYFGIFLVILFIIFLGIAVLGIADYYSSIYFWRCLFWVGIITCFIGVLVGGSGEDY